MFLTGSLDQVASWTRNDCTIVDQEPKNSAAMEPRESVAPARSRKAIVQWLTERIAGPLGVSPGQIDTGRPLASFGIGSLQAVSLAGDLERWLGRELSPVLIYEHPTIDAIAGYLSDESKPIRRPCGKPARGIKRADRHHWYGLPIPRRQRTRRILEIAQRWRRGCWPRALDTLGLERCRAPSHSRSRRVPRACLIDSTPNSSGSLRARPT